MSATHEIVVPCSTSNLGPGFDSLGLALSRWLRVTLRFGNSEAGQRLVRLGEGQGFAPPPDEDLFLRAFRARCEALGADPSRAFEATLVSDIPLARGLGSSGACIVAATMSADAALGRPHDPDSVFQAAAAFEGHPDNVAPSVYGGLTCAVSLGAAWHALALGRPTAFSVVVAIPPTRAATEAMRAVLPDAVPHAAARSALARAVFLSHALLRGELGGRSGLFDDALHQPYRSAHLPGFASAVVAARKAGALGVFLSGSGSTVCALVRADADPRHPRRVGAALERAYLSHGLSVEIATLSVVEGATRRAAEAS